MGLAQAPRASSASHHQWQHVAKMQPFRQQQSAVRREAREDGVGKAHRWRATASTDVAHVGFAIACFV